MSAFRYFMIRVRDGAAERRRSPMLWLVAALSTACGGGDSPGTTEPPPSLRPTSIQLSSTSFAIAAGETFQLTAIVKDQNGLTLATLPSGFTISWTSSDTTHVTVDGTGLARGIRPGDATITARGGTLSATAAGSVRGELLSGSQGDAAETAIPFLTFVPRIEDYTANHPDLAGMYLSFNTLSLILKLGTTVSQANAILGPLQAQIVGGLPGVAGVAPGILYLRLPTTSHAQMEATLASLRGNPAVVSAVQDMLMALAEVTKPNAGGPADWAWEKTPTGANYGLEMIRVPQLWNLNAALRKAGGQDVAVGVLDGGFAPIHPDLTYLANLSPISAVPTLGSNHGTHVAGTIAAEVNNGKGVDGVSPFADLVVRNALTFTVLDSILASMASLSATDYALRELIIHQSRPPVINISMQLQWCGMTPPVNSATSASAQTIATAAGQQTDALLKLLESQGYTLPLIVAAAGNCTQPARWGSAWNNAALVHGNPNILIVESVDNAPTSTGGATLSSFSNVGGDVSAPGGSPGVWSTAHSPLYDTMVGTSMAAPHVTGLASYLKRVDPGLTTGQLRGLLKNTSNTVAVAGGAVRRVDAFATVLDIDRIRGNDRVLTMLLDVDDGSPDGNRRVDHNNVAITSDDLDQDGGPGDGAVDMSDFRRFRDWLLQAENPAGLSLDGAVQHPKKDLNGDGQIGTPVQENVYPRGDFNGDGVIDRVARSVRGFTTPVTDLQVLEHLFSDPNYQASQLQGLLDSGDILVDASDCFFQPGAVRVATSIKGAGTSNILEQRTHLLSSARQVYTAAPQATGYTVRLEVFNSANLSLLVLQQDFPLALGGDANWVPDCSLVKVTVSPSLAALTPGMTRTFTASVTGTSNTGVTWTATGGTITSGGLFTAGQTLGTFEVKATSVANPTKSGTAQVTISAALPPKVSFDSRPSGERRYWAWIGSNRACDQGQSFTLHPPPSLSLANADCNLPTDQPHTGRGSSDVQVTLSGVNTDLPSMTANIGASFNLSSAGQGGFAGGSADVGFNMRVQDGAARLTVTGSLSAQGSDNTVDTHRYAYVRVRGSSTDVVYAIAGRLNDTDPLEPSSVPLNFSVVLPPGTYGIDVEIVSSGHDGGTASPHTRNGSARADVTLTFSHP